jgi:hypothetical protein
MNPPLEVVLCPHPPLLVRELAGRQDPVAGLRAACHRAVSRLVSSRPARIAVVGPADVPRRWDGVGFDVRRFGTTYPRPVAEETLPLSLGIGRMLLDQCAWDGRTDLLGIGWDADAEQLAAVVDRLGGEGTGVLLLGDGSACRSEKAPGYLDRRAFGYDDLVADALAGGDASALRELDIGLGAELMVGGRSVLRLLGMLAGERAVTAALDHREDPFGVSYFVARWRIG